MDFSNYIIGGLASTGATVVTNPLEVIKTRYQLQGELAARGTYVEPYRSIPQAFYTIAKNEGVPALQKGLVPALYFQFILNMLRLGIYSTADGKGWIKNKKNQSSFAKGMFWGATGGIVGCVVSSPFFLVKTHLQSQAATSIAVGYQYKHKGMLDAFSDIYSKNGVKGLYRGVLSTIPRAALGSGAQIATFGTCKDYLSRNDIVTNPILNSFTAGAIAGTVMSLAITPPDVIATRLYNQGVDEKGKGLYYKGVIDCFWKVWKQEGIYGLYKGYWAQYLRIGPHSTLVLLFFDYLCALRDRYRKNVL